MSVRLADETLSKIEVLVLEPSTCFSKLEIAKLRSLVRAAIAAALVPGIQETNRLQELLDQLLQTLAPMTKRRRSALTSRAIGPPPSRCRNQAIEGLSGLVEIANRLRVVETRLVQDGSANREKTDNRTKREVQK